MENRKVTIGVSKGEVCNRNECLGLIDERESDNGCSCHINPPCSHCVDDRHYCPLCGWEAIDEQKQYAPIFKESEKFVTPDPVDDGFKYNVRQFFDDHFERFNGKDLTYPEAVNLRNKLNSKDRHYVYHDIVKVEPLPTEPVSVDQDTWMHVMTAPKSIDVNLRIENVSVDGGEKCKCVCNSRNEVRICDKDCNRPNPAVGNEGREKYEKIAFDFVQKEYDNPYSELADDDKVFFDAEVSHYLHFADYLTKKLKQ